MQHLIYILYCYIFPPLTAIWTAIQGLGPLWLTDGVSKILGTLLSLLHEVDFCFLALFGHISDNQTTTIVEPCWRHIISDKPKPATLFFPMSFCPDPVPVPLSELAYLSGSCAHRTACTGSVQLEGDQMQEKQISVKLSWLGTKSWQHQTEKTGVSSWGYPEVSLG